MADQLRHLVQQYNIKSVREEDLALMEASSASASASNDDIDAQSMGSTELSSLVDMREIEVADGEMNLLRQRLERERAQRYEEQQRAVSHINTLQGLLHRAQTRYDIEIKEMRDRLANIESNGPAQQHRLKIAKDDLCDLIVSESVYLEFKAIPEHQRSLREFVVVQVFETIKAERQRSAALQLENEKNLETLREAQAAATSAHHQLKRLEKSSKQTEDDLVAEVARLETRCRKLTDEVSTLSVRVEDGRAKEQKFDDVAAALRRLEVETASLQQKSSVDALASHAYQKERDEAVANLSEAQQALEILRLDKSYLNKENEKLREVLCRSEHNEASAREDLASIRRERDQLLQKYEMHKLTVKKEQEEKLEAELDRLRKRSDSELQAIRESQKQAYEREIRGVEQARDLALEERTRIQTRFDEAGKAIVELRNEKQKVTSALETELAEVRASLRMKVFEADRLAIVYEESVNLHSQAMRQAEKLEKRGDVIRTEYYKLRGEMVSREAEVQVLKQRLEVYESLENELEEVIDEGVEDDGVVATIGSTVASTRTRRIRQSLALAQRVVKQTKEMSRLTAELDDERKRSDDLQKQLNAEREQLSAVQQPYNFLIDMIRARDDEINRSKSVIEKLRDDLMDTVREYEKVEALNSKLQQNVDRLMKQHEHLNELRDALESHLYVPCQLPRPNPGKEKESPEREVSGNEAVKTGGAAPAKHAPMWFQHLARKKAKRLKESQWPESCP